MEEINIYKIDFPNGKCYIGKTVDSIESRFYSHCAQAYSIRRESAPCQDAIVEFGPNALTLSLLERTTDEKREGYWIDYYGIENCYNVHRVAQDDRTPWQRERVAKYSHLQDEEFAATASHLELRKANALYHFQKIAEENLNKEMPTKELKSLINGIRITHVNGNGKQMTYKKRVELFNEIGYDVKNLGEKRVNGKRMTLLKIIKT